MRSNSTGPGNEPQVKGSHMQNDETFRRHGPEPPENDSGPSPSIEEMERSSDLRIRNVDPNEQVD